MSFVIKRRANSGKMARQVPHLTLSLPATTPCENELFAADGQMMQREGSHNVKKRAEIFT